MMTLDYDWDEWPATNLDWDEEDDEDEPEQRNTFVDGKLHVRQNMCSTCIFHDGNRMHLEEGRAESMRLEADAEGGVIPCHKHLHEGQPIQPVCRGYFDRNNSIPVRMAVAMEIIEWFHDSVG